MWATWILLVIVALGSFVGIVRGLNQESRTVSYDGGDVLVGCIVLVLCGFAAHAVWGR